MTPTLSFSSYGKLLITGEYLVLKGALALAIPLKAGQILQISERDEDGILRWESHDIDGVYLNASFNTSDLEILDADNKDSSIFIQKLLKACRELSPGFLYDKKGYQLISRIDFSRKWGWGSSSTTISNLAQWAGVDPFSLFFSTQNGSGYDVATAASNKPILYQLRDKHPVFEKVKLNQKVFNELVFIYTGKKVDTARKVMEFKNNKKVRIEDMEKISAISKAIIGAKDTYELIFLINEHERIISNLLDTNTISEKSFPDFQGALKSLGAWGGDFIMATSVNGSEYIKDYFHKKGLKPYFSFSELAL